MSFLEGFQFVLKCLSIRFDASLGLHSQELACEYQENIIHSSNDLILIEAIYSSVSFHSVLEGSLEDFC